MSDIWQLNLAALSEANRPLAAILRDTPAAELEFTDTPQGAISATWTTGGRKITLASRYKPLDEARTLAETVDIDKHAAIVVVGFGLGHHLRQIIARIEGKALLVIYEPDAGLLRAVLERVDCREILAHKSVLLLTGDVAEADLVQRLEGKAAYITQGVQFVTFAPTRQVHAAATKTFMERFTRFVSFCRTNIATTLVNAAVTCRNLTQNVARYAAGDTVKELLGAASGYPAVVVSAGPSLAKNVHLLTQPGVREKVVIIAVQTVLKPLLERGVRPHFVTALDYHEISRRFYEGLPRLDDVTLVAEPKANRAILDHYPGPIRVLQSNYLDVLIGPLARPIPKIRAGSTVAHLSLYLAQHLGCDPIIFIGQDLGFSDGLYYCPGTAIHDVWAGELGAFNTLEMMEWKRIARHKTHLARRTDVHGKPIYSDEQMLTYLAQFERDFTAAPQKIIDATEGGMPKAGTTRMTLAEALRQYAGRDLPIIPAARAQLDARRLAALLEHLTQRMREVQQLRQTAEQTTPILRDMLADQRDARKMEKHFDELMKKQKRVRELDAAFRLVGELNQIGAFKRIKADRAIKVADDADPLEKQRMQLERDLVNLQWLIEGCDEAVEIFREALARLEQQTAARPADQAVGEALTGDAA